MTQEFHIRVSTHAYYFSDRNISYFRRFFRKWKSPLKRADGKSADIPAHAFAALAAILDLRKIKIV